MSFLLDTDTCSHHMKRPTGLTHRFIQHMGRLSADQREVLLLAAVEELRYEEIAGILSIPVGTVMSRLSRARNTLRNLVTERASTLRVVK